MKKSEKSINQRQSFSDQLAGVILTSFDVIEAHGRSMELDSALNKSYVFSMRIPLYKNTKI